jgi:phthiocerol/phenolphthiocerol synthesis type-I polyketide synthase D
MTWHKVFVHRPELLGSGGQANYVAANGWLDAWSVGAVARGHSATSVQWGAWSGGGGMVGLNESFLPRLPRHPSRPSFLDE